MRKSIYNIGSKTVIMTNKVIREASRCANCMLDKSYDKIRFLKQKHNKGSGWNNINTTLSIY